MGRKPNPDKKPKGADDIIVRTHSPLFYKAFIFEKEPLEMQADVCGDTFSDSIEKAVVALLMDLPMVKICKIPSMDWFVSDNKVDHSEITNPLMDKIIVICVMAHYDKQFEENRVCSETSDLDFWIPLQSLTEGYTLGCQEYNLESLTVKSKTATDQTRNMAISFEAHVSDEHTMNNWFPTHISVSNYKLKG